MSLVTKLVVGGSLLVFYSGLRTVVVVECHSAAVCSLRTNQPSHCFPTSCLTSQTSSTSKVKINPQNKNMLPELTIYLKVCCILQLSLARINSLKAKASVLAKSLMIFPGDESRGQVWVSSVLQLHCRWCSDWLRVSVQRRHSQSVSQSLPTPTPTITAEHQPPLRPPPL